MVIQFLLSTTLSRVLRVSIKGDYSPNISSGVENYTIVTEGHSRSGGCGHDSEENVDGVIRACVIVFTIVQTIIHQISVETSSVNLSGLKLLILHLLQLLPPLLLILLLCRSSIRL